MWGWMLLAAAGVIWFVWLVRRPHHHRSGGGRALDGYRYVRAFPQDLTDQDRQPHHPGPGDYDGD